MGPPANKAHTASKRRNRALYRLGGTSLRAAKAPALVAPHELRPSGGTDISGRTNCSTTPRRAQDKECPTLHKRSPSQTPTLPDTEEGEQRCRRGARRPDRGAMASPSAHCQSGSSRRSEGRAARAGAPRRAHARRRRATRAHARAPPKCCVRPGRQTDGLQNVTQGMSKRRASRGKPAFVATPVDDHLRRAVGPCI